MKTGLGLHRKLRVFYSYINLLRFHCKKYLFGFDIANIFIKSVDKISLLRILKAKGAEIGENCDIESGQTFHNCKNYKNLVIGNNCHIGKNCFFDLRDKIEIGDRVVISMQCSFITHIDMSKSNLSSYYPSKRAGITVLHDSYLGMGTTILKGVRIGPRGITAARSLVKKNVDKNQIVGGIPAQVIKYIDE